MKPFPRIVASANQLSPAKVFGWESAWGLWFAAIVAALIQDGIDAATPVLMTAAIFYILVRLNTLGTWCMLVAINFVIALLFFATFVARLF